MMDVMIGVDPHKRSHTATMLDRTERELQRIDSGGRHRPGRLVLQRVPGHDEDPQRGRHTRLGARQAGPAESQLGQHLVTDRSLPQHLCHLQRKAGESIGASIVH